MWRLPAAVTLCCVLCCVPSLAQDRVTIQRKNTLRPIIVFGQILDYTGNLMTIRGVGGMPQTVDADSILSVETNYDQDHLDARAALAANDVDKAVELFGKALQKEPREWVRREIMAAFVRCHLRRDDWLAAARQFLEITRSDPVTRHWGTAPLVWSPVTMNPQLLQQARGWLVDDGEAARLIGASWLLLDPMQGEAAEHEMRRLSRTTNERITSLARAQAWRLTLSTRTAGEAILQSWRSDIERFPAELRGGPQYLLGRGIMAGDERRLAASELLWLPLVYGENEPLSARALREAADLLADSGLEREAATLYAELLARYGWSKEAAAGEQRLRVIQSGGTGGQ